MLAAAKARARKAQRSEAATSPPDSSMQYSRLKIYVEAILEYGVGKLANEIFEQTDGSLPSAARGGHGRGDQGLVQCRERGVGCGEHGGVHRWLKHLRDDRPH